MACSRGRAQPASVPPVSTPDVAAEIAALLARKWLTSVSVEAAYGYRDNLVLSSTDEERSAFARGSVQFLLMRLPLDRIDFSTGLQAERSHFFSGRTMDHEASV